MSSADPARDSAKTATVEFLLLEIVQHADNTRRPETKARRLKSAMKVHNGIIRQIKRDRVENLNADLRSLAIMTCVNV